MRIFGLLTILFFTTLQLGWAQAPASGADQVAQQLCTCINQQHEGLDESIQMALAHSLRYQLDEQISDLQRYLKRLSESTRLRLDQQLQLLRQRGPLARPCLQKLEETMMALDISHPMYASLTVNEFNYMILQSLQRREDGALASILWEMGLRMQQASGPASQVTISEIRQR